MSESENLLSRWSRLKRASSAAQSTPDGERRADELPDAGVTSPPVLPDAGVTPHACFDPAHLPSIESIGANTDIRPFLAAGVPTELKHAALRSTWAADPAIRDFIGIAENQWDFNDPAAMPGFGSLGAAEITRHLAARALAGLNSGIDGLPQHPAATEQPAVPSSEPQPDEPVAAVREVTWAPSDGSQGASPVSSRTAAVMEPVSGGDAAGRPSTRAVRSHGGALPE